MDYTFDNSKEIIIVFECHLLWRKYLEAQGFIHRITSERGNHIYQK